LWYLRHAAPRRDRGGLRWLERQPNLRTAAGALKVNRPDPVWLALG
jgi:hypothetical protein